MAVGEKRIGFIANGANGEFRIGSERFGRCGVRCHRGVMQGRYCIERCGCFGDVFFALLRFDVFCLGIVWLHLGHGDAITGIFFVRDTGGGGQHDTITRRIGGAAHSFEHSRQIVGNFCAARTG